MSGTRYLLDTHILVWAMSAPERLSVAARDILTGTENQLAYSTLAFYEAGIKQSIYPEVRLFDFATIEADCERAGLARVDLRASHAAALAGLPMHHRDPFDRMLVAQAKVEGMRLLTADRALAAYGADVEFVGVA
ncbi:type II toxin-antitoxin system VapC family toxin [Casimicrobium huifangae]|uniref:type II toxin-antitoxin system VapC family toxin n=1 Tax=Casimicrobium huifangae TaxID=2591109 RepID=UPI0012EB7332|nr:type II toxin-antitoxin system VapC family toxin [Casimicrobium huifangae]